jgi:hypothetical protein
MNAITTQSFHKDLIVVDHSKLDGMSQSQLVELAKDINGKAIKAAKQTLIHAGQTGIVLLALKEKIPHGQFLKYVESLTEIPARTAQTYMSIAANYATVAHLRGVRDAIRFIREAAGNANRQTALESESPPAPRPSPAPVTIDAEIVSESPAPVSIEVKITEPAPETIVVDGSKDADDSEKIISIYTMIEMANGYLTGDDFPEMIRDSVTDARREEVATSVNETITAIHSLLCESMDLIHPLVLKINRSRRAKL